MLRGRGTTGRETTTKLTSNRRGYSFIVEIPPVQIERGSEQLELPTRKYQKIGAYFGTVRKEIIIFFSFRLPIYSISFLSIVPFYILPLVSLQIPRSPSRRFPPFLSCFIFYLLICSFLSSISFWSILGRAQEKTVPHPKLGIASSLRSSASNKTFHF